MKNKKNDGETNSRLTLETNSHKTLGMIGQKPRSLITLEKRGSTTKAATFFPSLTDFNFIVSETKRIFKDFSLRAGFSLPNPYSPSFARSSNSTFCETKMARRKFRSKPPELQARRRFGFFAQEHEHVCVSFLNQLQSSENGKTRFSTESTERRISNTFRSIPHLCC